MKTKRHEFKHRRHPISFEEAIARRAAKGPQRRWVRSGYHGTMTYDVAVEDGTPPPMSHYGDVGPRGCLLS